MKIDTDKVSVLVCVIVKSVVVLPPDVTLEVSLRY